ncbi:MAG TPA: helix-turn-helix transcriptional regulator [Candidatus Elarobacter sp.]|jgi:transcriptional regulator with XRE-family HTH domain
MLRRHERPQKADRNAEVAMSGMTSTRSPALEALRVNVVVGRARCRLSQSQLAERAGVSRPTISRIERGSGDVGVDVVQRIADALDVSVAQLFEPTTDELVDDDELVRRAATPADQFIDADALFDAIDEAAGRPIRRYSRAGRPRMAR